MTVPLLMVMPGNQRTHIHHHVARIGLVHFLQSLMTHQGVFLHGVEFRVCQLVRFEQDQVGNTHLAHVVQRAGVVDILHKGAIHDVAAGACLLQFAGQQSAELLYSGDMVSGVVIP